jgi:hypothetical protein
MHCEWQHTCLENLIRNWIPDCFTKERSRVIVISYLRTVSHLFILSVCDVSYSSFFFSHKECILLKITTLLAQPIAMGVKVYYGALLDRAPFAKVKRDALFRHIN